MGDNRFHRSRFLRMNFPRDITPAEIKMGHNGGPPLDDPHVPEWGSKGIGNYFVWKAAVANAFDKVPDAVAIRRAKKAISLGLTYREYSIEILERGRYLQASDTEAIVAIIARRKKP